MNSKIAQKLITLKNKDLKLRNKLVEERKLSAAYNRQMQELHDDNVKELSLIIDQIGYPTIDKVGREASDAAWLIVQHAIAHPTFMKKCLQLIEDAVNQDKASPLNYAYLSDRIAVFEGRPQLYGTQFDWNEEGIMSPCPFDDIDLVNKRRKNLGLNTLEEQTLKMKIQAKEENQQSPEDHWKRMEDYNSWRKSVGWI